MRIWVPAAFVPWVAFRNNAEFFRNSVSSTTSVPLARSSRRPVLDWDVSVEAVIDVFVNREYVYPVLMKPDWVMKQWSHRAMPDALCCCTYMHVTLPPPHPVMLVYSKSK